MRKLIYSSTQGHFFNLLVDIYSQSKNEVRIKTIVSDSSINIDLINVKPDERSSLKLDTLAEWKIYEQCITESDERLASEFEKNELKASLFKALVIDRRMFFGPKTKVRQDYKPRFSDAELHRRLVLMAATIIRDFDNLKPNLCLLFTMTNVQDYVIYALCKARGIKLIQLRSAKLENFITAFDDLFANERHVVNDISEENKQIAKKYLSDVTLTDGMAYEGAINKRKKIGLQELLRLIAGARFDLKRLMNSTLRRDNQIEAMFRHNFCNYFANPLRWKLHSKFFDWKIASKQTFFLYPLHFEPEVAIQFYGTPYLNQIELIRNIAISLPLGSYLVVKEHPRSYGVRSNGYYRALKKIPRVKLACPDIQMRSLIDYSQGIFTISGSTGLEAVIRGKPCWTFGRPYYSSVGSTMVRQINSYNDLDFQIIDLMEKFELDKEKIVKLLAFILGKSTRFNLYTEYLGKDNRYGGVDADKDVVSLLNLIERADYDTID